MKTPKNTLNTLFDATPDPPRKSQSGGLPPPLRYGGLGPPDWLFLGGFDNILIAHFLPPPTPAVVSSPYCPPPATEVFLYSPLPATGPHFPLLPLLPAVNQEGIYHTYLVRADHVILQNHTAVPEDD